MRCLFCGTRDVQIITNSWSPDDHGLEIKTETSITCNYCKLSIVAPYSAEYLLRHINHIDMASFRILDRLKTIENLLTNILKDSPNCKIHEVVNVVNDLGRIIHSLNLSLTAINERKKQSDQSEESDPSDSYSPSKSGNNAVRRTDYVVQNKLSYVGNNMLFNRKNNCGYCCDIEEAGHYTSEEAEKIYRQAPEKFTIWPLDYLRSKVSTCIDMQDCDHSFSVPCFKAEDIKS